MAVTTNEDTYSSGSDPEITMAISNGGDTACDRDVGAGANEIIISSGGVRIWSSDDCSTEKDADIVTLQPGEKATVTVTWPKTASEPGCTGDKAPVDSGFYDAVGRNGKVQSGKASFKLE